MAEKLTDKVLKGLPSPAKGNKITYDSEVKGFGVRVTSAGAKAFILNYRSRGVERRYTIGSHPDWSVQGARDEAKALKRRIDVGEDPMGVRHDDRVAATMNKLADRFEAEHIPKKRTRTGSNYKAMLDTYIRPAMGTIKVADIRHVDIERLHNRVAKRAPYQANRIASVLSKMFDLSIKWNMRSDNPAKGIERAPEEKRERFLTHVEVERLAVVLAAHSERVTADAIRLLLLTGARRGEVFNAKWEQFDLDEGVWTKPAATTKQAKLHRVPLSAPALLLLKDIHVVAEKERRRGGKVEYVFPGAIAGRPLTEPKRAWWTICRQAGLAHLVDGKDAVGKPAKVWRPTVRIHDLRHTYASLLASSGLSLPIIGALLGHSQPATTARYAHLLDSPLREATERVGRIVAGSTTKAAL